MIVKPRSLVRNLMNCHAAACRFLSLLSTKSPEPEYVGFAGWLPNAGSPAVCSSNDPLAALSKPARSAVLVTYMPSFPDWNSDTASLSAMLGWAPDLVRSCIVLSASTAAGLSSCGFPSADSNEPPLLLISDWVRKSDFAALAIAM